MATPDSGVEIPVSPRLAQVNAAILAERAARQSLVDESIPERFRLVLPQNSSHPGADLTHFGAETTQPAPLDPDFFRDAGKFTLTPPSLADSNQRFSDRIADSIHPGFGRIESKNSSNQWRFDFLDPSRCKTKSRFGLCFTMKLP
jgi:hypothetical protein